MTHGRRPNPWLFHAHSLRASATTLVMAGCLLSFADRSSAADLGLLVTHTPDPVHLSGTLTYTLTVTNNTTLIVTNILLTNVLSGPAQFLTASNFYGQVQASGNQVVFNINRLPVAEQARVTLEVRPTGFGTITNAAGVGSPFHSGDTNLSTTLVISSQSDLAVALTAPPAGVLLNDLTSYTVGATNLSPGPAVGVVLSNTLPAGLRLVSVAPSSTPFTFANRTLVFNVGALTNNAAVHFTVNIEPTNSGTSTLDALVGAPGLLDTNLANNSAIASFNVGTNQIGDLEVTILTAQTYNPQTGLMQQTIHLANTGEVAVASARVLISSFTNRVFNAVGTNGSSPFVVYAAALNPGESVDLILEYFIPTRVPVPDPLLTAVAVPQVNLDAPTSSPPNITKFILIAPGQILIEFSAMTGRTYTVLYSSDQDFATGLMAQPPIVAPANRVQWIDDGPPKTISPPASVTARFYRVLANP